MKTKIQNRKIKNQATINTLKFSKKEESETTTSGSDPVSSVSLCSRLTARPASHLGELPREKTSSKVIIINKRKVLKEKLKRIRIQKSKISKILEKRKTQNNETSKTTPKYIAIVNSNYLLNKRKRESDSSTDHNIYKKQRIKQLINLGRQTLNDNHIPIKHNDNFNKSNENVNIENETNKQINSIDLDTPQTFLEAVTSDDKDKWIEAISNELENLYNNETMSLVKKLPEGRKPIEYKWVFTKKYNDKGELEKYKARLVIKGFKQIEGIIKCFMLKQIIIIQKHYYKINSFY